MIKKILISKEGHIFFVKDLEKDMHTEFGFVKKDDLKKRDGSAVFTNKGNELTLMSPSFFDLYSKIKRGPAIMNKKDIGYIIAECCLGKDSIVVEAGGGSGALSCILGNICKKVYTYEIRKDFCDVVLENLNLLSIKNVEVKNKDVCKGIDEKSVDCVIYDLPQPWDAIESANDSLSIGGFLVCYLPSMTQVINFCEEIGKNENFILLRIVELIKRDWLVDGKRVRPEHQGLMHTGFLVFARKIRV